MRSQINDLYEFYPDAFRLEHTYHYTWYGGVAAAATAAAAASATATSIYIQSSILVYGFFMVWIMY